MARELIAAISPRLGLRCTLENWTSITRRLASERPRHRKELLS